MSKRRNDSFDRDEEAFIRKAKKRVNRESHKDTWKYDPKRDYSDEEFRERKAWQNR